MKPNKQIHKHKNKANIINNPETMKKNIRPQQFQR